MGWGSSDVYHQPEAFGLEVVTQMGDSEARWSFDLLVLWRRTEDGKLFWGSDSGCSCPSPFEEATHGVDDLHPLPETARDLDGELRRTRDAGGWVGGEYVPRTGPFWDAAEVLDFRRAAGL